MTSEISVEHETMEEIEQRFGSNKAALGKYLQARSALGLPDHRSASSQRMNERRPQRTDGGATAAQAAPSVKKPAPRAAVPAPKPRTPTAEEQAIARRKARHDTVMASPHAKDRPATAAGLLGGAPNLSANEIIAALATMPTDAQAIASVKRQAADAVWDRVHGVADAAPGRAAPVSGKQAAADAVWDRVNAKRAAIRELRV